MASFIGEAMVPGIQELIEGNFHENLEKLSTSKIEAIRYLAAEPAAGFPISIVVFMSSSCIY